jgi:hypothetical protein
MRIVGYLSPRSAEVETQFLARVLPRRLLFFMLPLLRKLMPVSSHLHQDQALTRRLNGLRESKTICGVSP